jgi:hypothetical protein
MRGATRVTTVTMIGRDDRIINVNDHDALIAMPKDAPKVTRN